MQDDRGFDGEACSHICKLYAFPAFVYSVRDWNVLKLVQFATALVSLMDRE
jgi:hypothetical protein